MTADEVRADDLREQRHALYDLDPDSVRCLLTYGPKGDGQEHCVAALVEIMGDGS
jgi:hypothetical protein